ncbi:MAG: efflux RND transporter periplasmic adaptor subunit, partial [Bacteroidota bacterium]
MSRSIPEPDRPGPMGPNREPAAPEPRPTPPAKRVVRVGRVRLSPAATIAAGVAVLLLLLVVTRVVTHKGTKTAEIPFEPVSLRNIALTVEATGAVEPIDLVEVKSKASGQIVKMPVQIGSVVKKGDLLAQVDPRDVRNSYDQTAAALRAAQANAQVTLAQKKRADGLFTQAVITAPEHETATLAYANAQSQVVKARTDLDLARQRLEDATVRAPISGTILEQPVTNGMVIASATSTASGGTTLLKMADLSRIRIRALVAETDVGNVRPGQAATVTVDAFPNRTFQGTVEKIEPQSVEQQSVTMFPVLISISNEDGLLLPGMNGEVSMLIDQREGVPAVPVDAVRSAREMPAVAELLGLKPDKVKAELDRQIAARAAERQARLAQGSGPGGAGSAAGGGTAGAERAGFGRGDSTRMGGRGGAGGG